MPVTASCMACIPHIILCASAASCCLLELLCLAEQTTQAPAACCRQASLDDGWTSRPVLPDAVATLGGAGDTPRSICAPWLAAAASTQQLRLQCQQAHCPQLPSAHASHRGAVWERQDLLLLGQGAAWHAGAHPCSSGATSRVSMPLSKCWQNNRHTQCCHHTCGGSLGAICVLLVHNMETSSSLSSGFLRLSPHRGAVQVC